MTLINAARAIELIPNFDSNDTQVIQDIVNACSLVIERYCNRTFALTTYDELYDGTGFPNLLLNNYPVTQLTRIMYNPVSVLYLTNQKTSVSRATFRLDSTNLYLVTMDSGVETTRTLTRASYLTLGALADAIDTYSADGWQGTALGNYASWAVSDLYAPQGGQEIRWTGASYIFHHAFGVPSLMQQPTIGEIMTSFGFQRGYQNYRVIYQAGYSTIPYDIQQACAELSAATYLQREVNPNLQSESLGNFNYTQIAEKTFNNLSIASKYALQQYRNVRIPKFRAY